MVNSLSISRKNVYKIIILDIISVFAVYMIPTLSHMVAFPLYYLDPMRAIILLGFMVNRNKYNSIFLAMTLPLVSYLLAGHPIAIKNCIMAIELMSNIAFLLFFFNRRIHTSIAVICSIAISKVIYYLLKYGAISFSLLNTDLIDTNLWYQLIVIAYISLIWSVYEYNKDSK